LNNEARRDSAREFSWRGERAGELRRDASRTGAHRLLSRPLERALNQTPHGIGQLPEQTLQNIKRIGNNRKQRLHRLRRPCDGKLAGTSHGRRTFTTRNLGSAREGQSHGEGWRSVRGKPPSNSCSIRGRRENIPRASMLSAASLGERRKARKSTMRLSKVAALALVIGATSSMSVSPALAASHDARHGEYLKHFAKAGTRQAEKSST
jgi:hypothetical protein